MVKRPLYIFDLDGTLALIQHRRHFVEAPPCPVCLGDWNRLCACCGHKRTDPSFVQDWEAFYSACVEDQPNASVIQTLDALLDSGAEVWIFSGRSDVVRKETIQWLHRYTSLVDDPTELNPVWLQMRPAGDYTRDEVLKEKWLNSMLDEDLARLVAVFDDRDRVVQMWRRNGFACFQVARGNF